MNYIKRILPFLVLLIAASMPNMAQADYSCSYAERSSEYIFDDLKVTTKMPECDNWKAYISNSSDDITYKCKVGSRTFVIEPDESTGWKDTHNDDDQLSTGCEEWIGPIEVSDYPYYKLESQLREGSFYVRFVNKEDEAKTCAAYTEDKSYNITDISLPANGKSKWVDENEDGYLSICNL